MFLGIIFLVALALAPKQVRRLFDLPVRFMPVTFQDRLHTAVDKAMSVSTAFQKPRIVAGLCLCTVAALTMDLGICWMLLLAFGWDLPISTALMLAFGFAVAGSLPSAPGYLGVYQAAAVLVLSLYGIEQNAAVLYAFALQFTLLGAFLFLGGGALYSLRRQNAVLT
jgi:hypothetical protein